MNGYVLYARICRNIYESSIFTLFVVLNILLAAAIVGLETYPQFANNNILNRLDLFVVTSFTVEVFLKMSAEKLKPWRYFTNREWKWNWFDFGIIITSYLSNVLNLKFLRVIRLARLTKLFKQIPQLNMIIKGLLGSMRFLIYIVALFFLILYVYAIIGVVIFAGNDPWHFRSINLAIATLLQVTVLDVRIYSLPFVLIVMCLFL